MKIIAGLGNPGREYEGTRHNVGFRVVDELARRYDLCCDRRKFKSLFCSGRIAGETCAIVKPQAYMNLSGEAVQQAVAWFGGALDDVLVICDDFHLVLGKLRVRRGGSSGGHKGLQSVADMLGSEAFPRLRIGIGEAGPGEKKDYVLSRFHDGEADVIAEAILKGADAAVAWVREGIEAYMNTFN